MFISGLKGGNSTPNLTKKPNFLKKFCSSFKVGRIIPLTDTSKISKKHMFISGLKGGKFNPKVDGKKQTSLKNFVAVSKLVELLLGQIRVEYQKSTCLSRG